MPVDKVAGGWCVARLVRCPSFSGPYVESQNIPPHSKQRGDSMIAVHDLISKGLLNENHGRIEPSCPFYELPRTEKALTPLAIFDACNGRRDAVKVLVDDPPYDITRLLAE